METRIAQCKCETARKGRRNLPRELKLPFRSSRPWHYATSCCELAAWVHVELQLLSLQSLDHPGGILGRCHHLSRRPCASATTPRNAQLEKQTGNVNAGTLCALLGLMLSPFTNDIPDIKRYICHQIMDTRDASDKAAPVIGRPVACRPFC